MPVVVPLIIGGLSAAGSLGAAAIASKASKKAAETQAESGTEALALQKEMYGQTRADLAPYRDTGASAMTTLGALMGLPAGGGSASAGGPTPKPFAPGARVPPAGAQYTGTFAIPRTREGGSTAEEQFARRALPRSDSGYGEAPVLMQAPDGTQQAVPASQVAHYQARGAAIVRS